MVRLDFISDEDERELKELLDLNESIEEKIERAIYFFQKISPKYEIEAFIECLSSIFLDAFHNLNSRLISFFFIEIFCLRAPEYYGSEENERNYVILPALTLAKLNKKGYDLDKIVGGFLQLDHEGDMSYQISQIIEYLLENDYIEDQDFVRILKNILINDYASSLRIGRLFGILLEFKILEINEVIKMIQTIRIDLNLEIKQLSEIIFGTYKAISSYKIGSYDIGTILLEKILELDNLDLKFMTDQTYISDQATGLAIIISYYLYDNKSLSHLIQLIFKIDAAPVLAEAFKYLIDNSIINMKRLGLLLHDEFSNRRLDFSLIPSLISINFSYFEISKLLANIFGTDSDIVDNKDFIEILSGFYDPHYHRFDKSDVKQIFNYLHKINPKILSSLEIKDYDDFVGKINSIKKNNL